MIDTHVHLASDDLDRYPHAAEPPFHTEPYVHTCEQLIGQLSEAGVVAATVVQPFGMYSLDNSYQADSAAAHPGVLAGICGVGIGPDAAAALEHWTMERGMVGGRIVTLGQGIRLDDPGLLEVFAAAAKRATPMCVLTSRKHVSHLVDLARRFPEVPIVLDHLGLSGGVDPAPEVRERLRPLFDVANLYFKISTPMLASGDTGAEIVADLIAGAGTARIMWGTNFPVTDVGGYAATVAVSRAALAHLEPADRAQITCGTARALWPSLSPPPDDR